MLLAMIGINHKQAGLAVREKLSLNEAECNRALAYLSSQQEVAESFLVSTCNRTELYLFCKGVPEPGSHFEYIFRETKKLKDTSLLNRCYIKEGEEAIRHLFMVAAGLDSMVLGESEILGQLKTAYLRARSAGTHGLYSNSLCERALAAGKKVQTETMVGRHPVSFGYAAAVKARLLLSSLQDKNVLVIGTGEMAKITLRNLCSFGAGRIDVVSRRRPQAAMLAEKFNGRAVEFKEMPQLLPVADVVLCATEAPHYIITAATLSAELKGRERGPLVIIDLGVPRNVEPAVAGLADVLLYNLDDLEEIIRENLQARMGEAREAAVIVERQVDDFIRWQRQQQAVPLISLLRSNAEAVRQHKLEEFADRLGRLEKKERQTVEKLTASLVNALLKPQIANIKKMSLQDDYAKASGYLQQLYGDKR